MDKARVIFGSFLTYFFRQIDNRCEIIRCPAISTPINGGFEGGECDNRYRSNCKAFCNEGYDLVGSSNFTCSLNGTWQTDNFETKKPFCRSNKIFFINFCFVGYLTELLKLKLNFLLTYLSMITASLYEYD